MGLGFRFRGWDGFQDKGRSHDQILRWGARVEFQNLGRIQVSGRVMTKFWEGGGIRDLWSRSGFEVGFGFKKGIRFQGQDHVSGWGSSSGS